MIYKFPLTLVGRRTRGQEIFTKQLDFFGVIILLLTHESNGILEPDGILKPDGILESYGILEPDGILESYGILEPDCILESYGILEPDSILESDGILVLRHSSPTAF